MSEIGDTFAALDAVMKERKARLGVNCPACTIKLPKAIPKVLLPGQRCWCKYQDPRPNQSYEVWAKQDIITDTKE